MKLLSFALPGFNGVDRGWGRIEFPAGGGSIDEAGGEGNVGWRKPPGPGVPEVEVIGRDGVECIWDDFPWGSSLTEREGEARWSILRAVYSLELVSRGRYFQAM